jgi:hypothetical protein
MVQLYHAEAEASVCLEDGQAVFVNKPRFQPQKLTQIISSGVWKIEHLRLEHGGEPLLVGPTSAADRPETQLFRLKNIASNLYLKAHNVDGALGATQLYDDPACNFSFSSVRGSGAPLVNEAVPLKRNAHVFLNSHSPAGVVIEKPIGAKVNSSAWRVAAGDATSKDSLAILPIPVEEVRNVIKVRNSIHAVIQFTSRLASVGMVELHRAEQWNELKPGLSESIENDQDSRLREIRSVIEAATLGAMVTSPRVGLSVRQPPSEDERTTVRSHWQRLLTMSRTVDIVRESGEQLHVVLSTLVCMCTSSSDLDPMTREGEPCTETQELIEEQHGLMAVISLLRTVLDELRIPVHVIEDRLLGDNFVVCLQLCLRLLKQVVKGNSRLKMMLAAHTELLMRLLGTELQPASTLMEMYRDNMTLLSELQSSTVSNLVKVIKDRGKQSRFITFLSAFCICDGIAIPANQNMVIEQIVANKDAIICVARLSSSARLIIDDLDCTDCNLHDELSFGDDDPSANHHAASPAGASSSMKYDNPGSRLQYHVACIELFASLCFGRNRRTVAELLRLADRISIRYSDLLSAIRQTHLPQTYRSACCLLLLNLYVDSEPQLPVRLVSLTRIWSDVKNLVAPSADRAVMYDDFPSCAPTPRFDDLKEDILAHLSLQNSVFDLSNREGNLLTARKLHLCLKLVHFGFYHTSSDSLTLDLEANFDSVQKLVRPIPMATCSHSCPCPVPLMPIPSFAHACSLPFPLGFIPLSLARIHPLPLPLTTR